MTPQALRARITPDWKSDREKDRAITREGERLWQQGLSRIEQQDELDERHLAQGQSVRSAHNAQKRAVHRRFKMMAEIDMSLYPPLSDDTIAAFAEFSDRSLGDALHSVSWGPIIDMYFKKWEPAAQGRAAAKIAGNRVDIQNNYLYTEWKKQAGRKTGIKTYPVYALFVAMKAAIALVTTRTHSLSFLQEVHDSERSPWPDREAAIRFKESRYYNPNSPESIIGYGSQVPGLLGLAETLILHYSDFVRAERTRLDKDQTKVVDSPLPDDPFEETIPERYEIPYDIRLENAVNAYLAKEGSAAKVATRYGIGQKTFRQELRDRGYLATPGGDRKGKNGE